MRERQDVVPGGTRELELEPTGERFIPELMSGQLLEAEHLVRYALATQVVEDRRVLDAGCGVGWGSSVLLEAGARSVTGLDLSTAAVNSARAREPGASFVQGDLCRLPFADGSFDVVVCFEAVEHAPDTERALDELVRVLAPTGILLVSSPNPDVYPAGNPFHVREYRPAELLEALQSRLPEVSLWRQQSLVAARLAPSTYTTDARGVMGVQDLPTVGPGHDPYSVAVASRATMPELTPLVVLAPSDQLDHLAAASEHVEEERAELARATAALRDEALLVADQTKSLTSRVKQLMEAEDVRASEAVALRLQVDALTAERKELSVLLLEAEQEAARLVQSKRDPIHVDVAYDEIRAQLEQAEASLRATLASTSWRVSAPVRWLARLRGR